MAEEQTKSLLKEIAPLLEGGDREALRRWLDSRRESDIAELVEAVDPDQARRIFDALTTPEAAQVLSKVNEATRTQVIAWLDDREIQALSGELDPDKIHVPSIFVKRIFQGVNYEKRIERRTLRKRQ
jgi:Mg/Co/Ni transporter MgtE